MEIMILGKLEFAIGGGLSDNTSFRLAASTIDQGEGM